MSRAFREHELSCGMQASPDTYALALDTIRITPLGAESILGDGETLNDTVLRRKREWANMPTSWKQKEIDLMREIRLKLEPWLKGDK